MELKYLSARGIGNYITLLIEPYGIEIWSQKKGVSILFYF